MGGPDTGEGGARTRKERAIKLAVGLAIVVAAAVGLLKPLLLDTDSSGQVFDPVAWRQSVTSSTPGACDAGLRASMVDDLIATRLDPGLAPRDVVALLGRPAGIETSGDTSRYEWPTSEDDQRACMRLAVVFEDGRLTFADDVDP